ncbi:MAG: electron transfer flavoprotein subunit beta [Candidatus Lokiarchaeota archaeon]|nr:electron transfer flavoprotein subunit beta [Candidatus Lokiarchaeota archaeon]MBD3342794.1 electron transfer flavoprotein subunit beta [Candidatus Lokiarchaeota archaeon]
MKIFICIKQVPGIQEVRIDPKTNTLVREGIPSIMNPHDKHGVQLALDLKKENNAEVIALSMGPPQAEEVLREALAMCVDQAYLLTDRAFAGADTLATSHVLALAVKKLIEKNEKYIVICGVQAIDGDTAQVGPEMAEELSIPQITYVINFEIKKDKAIVERTFRPEETVIIESPLPVLVSVTKEINLPKYPALDGIANAYTEKEVQYLNAEDLDAKKENIGLTGSMTEVWKIFVPERKGEHKILEGSIEKQTKDLCNYLREDNIF